MMLSVPLLLLSLAAAGAAGAAQPSAHPQVTLDTTLGKIVIELYPDKSPKSVANFESYIKAHHYDGTIFHRVIPGFMVQGGGFSADMKEKATKAPIKNESDNGLSNERGTIAMARLPQPDTASAQFFINVSNNKSLDYQPGKWGYAVFGKVVEGMDVVDKIVTVPTTTKNHYSDVPQEPIKILKATVSEAK